MIAKMLHLMNRLWEPDEPDMGPSYVLFENTKENEMVVPWLEDFLSLLCLPSCYQGGDWYFLCFL